MRSFKSLDNGTTRATALLRFLSSVAVVGLLVGIAPAGIGTAGESAGETTTAMTKKATLRGTTGPADAYKKVNGFVLPTYLGRDSDPNYREGGIGVHGGVTPETGYSVDGYLRTLRSTLGYIRENAHDAVFFRNTHSALPERDVAFELPNREVLRQSMMHSVNYESGLRASHASISDTVSATLRGSYTARERLERANVERARMHAALAAFLPRVEGTIEANKGRRNTLASGSFFQDTVSAGVEASVPIFTSGVNTNTYRQAKQVSIAADYSYLAEEHRASLEAITAHINLRLNRKIESRLAKNVQAVSSIANIAKKLFAAGDASRTDIAIARANVESAKSELDIARRTREEVQADYTSLTGKSAPGSLELSKASKLVPSTLEEALDFALANNPNLLSARHTATASEFNAKAVRGRFGPQIDAFGRYDKFIYDSVQPDRKDDYSIGVRLRVPLIDFTTVPTIDAARHEAAENGYRALEQDRILRRQVERQWRGYQSAKRRVAISRRQVNAVANSLKGARREFKAGFRSITDVLNDQVRLTRAQITLESAIHEQMLLAYELAFSTAQPSVQHLASSR